jgi:hypothetical protein
LEAKTGSWRPQTCKTKRTDFARNPSNFNIGGRESISTLKSTNSRQNERIPQEIQVIYHNERQRGIRFNNFQAKRTDSNPSNFNRPVINPQGNGSWRTNRKLEATTGSWRPQPEVGGQHIPEVEKCRKGWEFTRTTKYDFEMRWARFWSNYPEFRYVELMHHW